MSKRAKDAGARNSASKAKPKGTADSERRTAVFVDSKPASPSEPQQRRQARAGLEWAPFRSLPAYLGGKRRLTPLIFALLSQAVPRARWRDLTFVDPFLGGGSVSLFAKAQGFSVVCNDLALRSAAIGRALISNSSVKLIAADVIALLRKLEQDYPHTAEVRYSPSVFPRAHAQLLDRVLRNLKAFDEPRRSLAVLLVVKWALRVQPMSMLRGTDARAAHEGDLDRVLQRRFGHYLNAGSLLQPSAWHALAHDANTGVFPGRGDAFQQDVFAFLAHAKGDVLYLDPPYAGTSSYEREYAVLDDLLEGTTRETSGFSRSADLLRDLFAAGAHIPVWLVSLNNATLAVAEIEDLIRRSRRNLRTVEIPYQHLGSIASEKKNAENREFLILATN